MREIIGEAAVYEQLAEEAAELAQAALKYARILRNENPTPVTLEEARRNLIEEYTDVCVAADDLGVNRDMEIYISKLNRFCERVRERDVVDNLKGNVEIVFPRFNGNRFIDPKEVIEWINENDARPSDVAEHFHVDVSWVFSVIRDYEKGATNQEIETARRKECERKISLAKYYKSLGISIEEIKDLIKRI